MPGFKIKSISKNINVFFIFALLIVINSSYAADNDDIYLMNVNAKTSYRKKIVEILDDITQGQTKILNELNSVSSKAGARQIIRMIRASLKNQDDLIDDISKIDNLLKHIDTKIIEFGTNNVNRELIEVMIELKAGQKILLEKYKNIDTQFKDIDSSFVDVASRTGNQNILVKLQNIVTMNNNLLKHLEKISKEQSLVKNNTSDIKSQNFGSFTFIYILLLIFAGLIGFFIYHFKKFQNSVLQRHDRIHYLLIDLKKRIELPYDENEDLTVNDLHKIADAVKQKAIKQNWSKRKVEDKPAFI